MFPLCCGSIFPTLLWISKISASKDLGLFRSIPANNLLPDLSVSGRGEEWIAELSFPSYLYVFFNYFRRDILWASIVEVLMSSKISGLVELAPMAFLCLTWISSWSFSKLWNFSLQFLALRSLGPVFSENRDYFGPTGSDWLIFCLKHWGLGNHLSQKLSPFLVRPAFFISSNGLTHKPKIALLLVILAACINLRIRKFP